MKYLLYGFFLLSMISCSGPSTRSYDFSDFGGQTEGESSDVVARLPMVGVTRQRPESESSRHLQERLERIRASRSESVMNQISDSSERIDFKNVKLRLIQDDSLLLTLEAVREESKEIDMMKFQSLKLDGAKKKDQIISFQKKEGRSLYEVMVRGLCIGHQNEKCTNLVIEVSYLLNDHRIVRQYKFDLPQAQKPTPTQVNIEEEKETDVAPSAPEVNIVNEDAIKEDQTPPSDTNSLDVVRPEKRPTDLKAETLEEEGLGSGVYVLPDNEDDASKKPSLVLRDVGEVTDSYSQLDVSDQMKLSFSEEQIGYLEEFQDFQIGVFNQSKGFYADSSGRVEEDDQLVEGVKGLDIGADFHREEQYGSTLSKAVLEWTSKNFYEQHPNAPLCVNDVSNYNGGPMSGHSSHRNGLDIDISIPSTANNCQQSQRFHSWRKLVERDPEIFEKNWTLLKILILSQKVHVVFIDSGFIKKLCDYTKTLELNERQKRLRRRVFKKLHHISGHANHYHIRMKCNEQNVGCQTQGELTGSTCQ